MKCQTEPGKKIELMTWPVVLETSDGFEGFFQDSYNNLTSSVLSPQIFQHHTFMETH